MIIPIDIIVYFAHIFKNHHPSFITYSAGRFSGYRGWMLDRADEDEAALFKADLQGKKGG